MNDDTVPGPPVEHQPRRVVPPSPGTATHTSDNVPNVAVAGTCVGRSSGDVRGDEDPNYPLTKNCIENAGPTLSRELDAEGFQVPEHRSLKDRVASGLAGLCPETPEGRLRRFMLAALADALDGWRVGEFLDGAGRLFRARGAAPTAEVPGWLIALVRTATLDLCSRARCSGIALRAPLHLGGPAFWLCRACHRDLAQRLERRAQRRGQAMAGRTRALLESNPGRARPGRASEVPGEGAVGAPAAPSSSPAHSSAVPPKTPSAESSAEASAESSPVGIPDPADPLPCPACGVTITAGGELCGACA